MATREARQHWWDLTARYMRREWDGSVTELTSFDMTFAAELLHERGKAKEEKATDPQTVGEYILVRKGAAGVLDSLLGRMRDAIKQARKKK